MILTLFYITEQLDEHKVRVSFDKSYFSHRRHVVNTIFFLFRVVLPPLTVKSVARIPDRH